MKSLWVTIEGTSLQVDQDKGVWMVNGKAVQPDIIRLDDFSWNMILGDRTFQFILQEKDPATGKWIIEVNGKRVNALVETALDRLLKDMGMDTQAVKKVKDLKAPMPGLIREVKVKEGDVLAPGDPVLILEAMKMENVLKAPAAAVVKSLKVQAGDKVEKNAILILFE